MVEALNLTPSVNAQDLTASQRAATSGLITALQMARGGAGPVLVVAAEKRRTKTASPLELQAGDGAAALLVGTGPVVAKLIASASRTVDFVDHFRGEGFEFDYTWEERWIRDEGYNKIVPAALADLFKATDVKPADIAHFAMPCVLPRVAAGIAKKAGMPDTAVRDNLHTVCGETGAAHPLVMLARRAGARPSPATRSWSSASARAAMRCCSRRPRTCAKLAPRLGVKGHLARRKEETNYGKFLVLQRPRRHRARHARRGRQGDAAVLALPQPAHADGLHRRPVQEVRHAAVPEVQGVREPQLQRVPHARTTTPSPTRPPRCSPTRPTGSPTRPTRRTTTAWWCSSRAGALMIDFTDADAASVDVAAPMRMMFRIKDYDPQRGFTRYFWKAAPAVAAGVEAKA